MESDDKKNGIKSNGQVIMLSVWLEKHTGHQVTMGPETYAAFNCKDCNDKILVPEKQIQMLKEKLSGIANYQPEANK